MTVLTSSRLTGTPRAMRCSLLTLDRRQSSGRNGGSVLSFVNNSRLRRHPNINQLLNHNHDRVHKTHSQWLCDQYLPHPFHFPLWLIRHPIRRARVHLLKPFLQLWTE